MIIAKNIRFPLLLQHLLFWAGYILFQAISYGWEDTDALSFHLAPQVLTVIIPVTITITYINLYGLLPLLYHRHHFIAFSVSLLILLFSGGLLSRFLTHTFVLPWEAIHDPLRYAAENKNFWIPVRILRISLSFVPVIALTMLIELLYRAYLTEKHQQQQKQEGLRAELDFLKAQINPHFYFNTLNSLYALTLKGAENASQLVLRLSSLMHYMLYDTAAEKVSLQNEISHLENYLDIERLRYAGRLELSFQYSGDIPGKMIAPLLMMPFVENAFKHGLQGEADWITIDLTVRQSLLFLKVENSRPPTPRAAAPGGVGLKNISRRLKLLYPEKHQLELSQDRDTYRVQLSLEL